MTDVEIRQALKETFRPAEEVWGQSNPFAADSTWIGYVETEEIEAYLDSYLGKKIGSHKPHDSTHRQVVELISDILPDAGSELFDTGYSDEAVYVTPCPPWTPSLLIVTMSPDPADGNRLFTLVTCACGANNAKV